MRRAVREVALELLPVLLVLACLAAATQAILDVYRYRSQAEDEPAAPSASLARVEAAAPEPEPPAPPEPEPPAIEEPPIDPTAEKVAALDAEAETRREAARRADREADALAAAREQAMTRSATFRQRESLIRARLAALDAQRRQIEDEVESLARMRDVLARGRDELKAELAKAGSRDAFAVLPYKGPNGTWRRPIPIECRNGTATIEPGGPTFSLLELSLGRGRSSPLVEVLSRYVQHIEASESPDGAPVVPYVLFIVRPDGIRPYYEARSLLEPLGLTFGYELVEQDMEIEYPNLDDPAEWSETAPLRSRFADAAQWPLDPEADRPTGRQGAGSGSEFVWGGTAGAASDPRGNLAGPGGVGVASDPVGRSGADSGSINRPDRDGGFSGGAGGGVRSTLSEAGRSLPHLAGGGGLASGALDGIHPNASPSTPFGGTPLPREAPWPPVSRALVGTGSIPEAERPADRLPVGPGTLADPANGRPQVAGASPDGTPSGPTAGRNTDRNRLPGSAASSSALGQASTGILAGSGGAGTASSGTPGGGGTSPGTPGGSLPGGGLGAGPGLMPEPILDVTVVCRSDGVLIHPGGYRLSSARLNDRRLAETLLGVVRNRQAARPDVRYRPRIKFLVEPGGDRTYWEVRRQTALAGLGWPVWLEVAEGTVPGRLLDPEVLR